MTEKHAMRYRPYFKPGHGQKTVSKTQAHLPSNTHFRH